MCILSTSQTCSIPATPGREKLSLAFVQGERYPKRKVNALAKVNVHFTYTDERFVFIGERFFNRWDPMGLNQGARCWDRRQTRLSRAFKIPRSSGAAPISRLAAPLFFSFRWTWGRFQQRVYFAARSVQPAGMSPPLVMRGNRKGAANSDAPGIDGPWAVIYARIK